jgi:hypothetical protein
MGETVAASSIRHEQQGMAMMMVSHMHSMQASPDNLST